MTDTSDTAASPAAPVPDSIEIDGVTYVRAQAAPTLTAPAALDAWSQTYLVNSALAHDTGRWNRVQGWLRAIKSEL